MLTREAATLSFRTTVPAAYSSTLRKSSFCEEYLPVVLTLNGECPQQKNKSEAKYYYHTKLLRHVQREENFQRPSVEPEPTAWEGAPPEAMLQLEAAAPEPSGPCTSTAKHQPSEELTDLMPPAVVTGLSPGAENMAGDRAPVPCAEREELPAPAVEPEPTAWGGPPLETALQLEAAPEPSGPCTGTAKDQSSEELPDLRPPAVATDFSPGADSVAGDRQRAGGQHYPRQQLPHCP
ncbi:hypothetical protein H8959_019955 [Pygathrix nigripes]